MEGSMEPLIITVTGDNILSPLGLTSKENFAEVRKGRNAMRLYKGSVLGVQEPVFASMFNREALLQYIPESKELTLLERLCILSVSKALEEAPFDASDNDVIFVLSTTKGNVNLLADNPNDPRCHLAGSAKRIASFFGNVNMPIVVSNACVSGVCAQIAAVRALKSGKYRHAVVVGADLLSQFIVSGFQSFKALSTEPCKPFDKHRLGLNLGEAVATILLSVTSYKADAEAWHYAASSNHNDANHISGPSRTGEGAYRVLCDLLEAVGNSPAFVNVHGTATSYNDEMESIALHRAGLDTLPVNALKGYYGHTLGAAGILETIISMKAVDAEVVLATKGYDEPGTTWHPNVSPYERPIEGRMFIKLLSGFGGSNAGIAYRKGGEV
jgi:3-oxoacyl-[acyl-carrier-protein] synthase-1